VKRARCGFFSSRIKGSQEDLSEFSRALRGFGGAGFSLWGFDGGKSDHGHVNPTG